MDGAVRGEDDTKFHFVCDDRDIDYWMKADDPVILVCSHPETGEAWWVHVQPWFADHGHRASRRVDFNKATDAFGATVYAAQRKSERPFRQDFVLANNRIYVWRPMSGTSLALVPDAAEQLWPMSRVE